MISRLFDSHDSTIQNSIQSSDTNYVANNPNPHYQQILSNHAKIFIIFEAFKITPSLLKPDT
jgi:glutathionylspermidine synthase